MNVWSFTGNLGRDPEMRHLSDGKAILSFAVGVKSGYGDKATTTWANCSLFGKQAESLSQYLSKGSQVGIVGELSLREWTDKEGGKRQNLDVRVSDITLLSKAAAKQEPAPKKSKPVVDDDDSLPF